MDPNESFVPPLVVDEEEEEVSVVGGKGKVCSAHKNDPAVLVVVVVVVVAVVGIVVVDVSKDTRIFRALDDPTAIHTPGVIKSSNKRRPDDSIQSLSINDGLVMVVAVHKARLDGDMVDPPMRKDGGINTPCFCC